MSPARYSTAVFCRASAPCNRTAQRSCRFPNRRFPHWFAANFSKYNEKEEDLPLDQHLLPGLIAPRAVYYSSAKGDQWADPKGEYLGIQLGSRVASEIYGKKAEFQTEFEQLTGPVHLESVGYHIREGKHDLTWEDWRIFLDFVEKNL